MATDEEIRQEADNVHSDWTNNDKLSSIRNLIEKAIKKGIEIGHDGKCDKNCPNFREWRGNDGKIKTSCIKAMK